MTPAMGALNVAAIPAAAPQPTRVLILSAETLVSCPKSEPIAEPIWTMGPSRPADPPDPIHIAGVRILMAKILFLIIPPLIATASMVSETPGPWASLAKK